MSCRTIEIFGLLLAIVLATTWAVEEELLLDSRVVGGKKISIERAPYIVQFRDSGDSTYCGGTLVALDIVITAAHCLNKPKQTILQNHVVVGGVTTRSAIGEQRRMSDFIISPNYDDQTLDHDIAVVKLMTPMIRSIYVKPVGLCNKALERHEGLVVSGWGRTSANGRLSEVLRRTIVPVILHENCVKKYKNESPVTDAMVCAASGARDACQSDSGGPAIHDQQLCAVVSWGKGCGDGSYPGVYTSINATRIFIRDARRNLTMANKDVLNK